MRRDQLSAERTPVNRSAVRPADHPITRLQRLAGNAAVGRLLATTGRMPRVQRALAVVGSRLVGNEPTADNRLQDVRQLLEILRQIGMSNEDYTAQSDALPVIGKGKGKVAGTTKVAADKLAVLGKAIDATKVGSVAPDIARARLGIAISGSVGQGGQNAQADVDLVCEALRYEGIVTDPASTAALATSGLAELWHRILFGTRKLAPTVPGPPENAATTLKSERKVDQLTLLQWPQLLRADSKITPEQRKNLADQIAQNRSHIPARMNNAMMTKGKATRQTAAEHRAALSSKKKGVDSYHQGMSYTRAVKVMQAMEPNPHTQETGNAADKETAAAEAAGQDTKGKISRSRANELAWEEVRTEGSSGSINTYDSQWLTVGRGFGVASGQGKDVLVNLFASDPGFRQGMLHVGFSVENGTPVAVDPASGTLLSGTDALIHITRDQGVLSQYASMAESPEHIQNVVDAQWQVVRTHAAAVPDVVLQGNDAGSQPWDPQAIQFAIHANHFATGACSWKRLLSCTTDGKGDIKKMAKLALAVAAPREKHGSSILWTGENSRVLEWGHRAFGSLVQAQPVEDSIADDGRFYFPAGKGKFRGIAL